MTSATITTRFQFTQGGAPQLAELVYNSNFTIVYGCLWQIFPTAYLLRFINQHSNQEPWFFLVEYIKLLSMVYKPTYSRQFKDTQWAATQCTVLPTVGRRFFLWTTMARWRGADQRIATTDQGMKGPMAPWRISMEILHFSCSAGLCTYIYICVVTDSWQLVLILVITKSSNKDETYYVYKYRHMYIYIYTYICNIYLYIIISICIYIYIYVIIYNIYIYILVLYVHTYIWLHMYSSPIYTAKTKSIEAPSKIDQAMLDWCRTTAASLQSNSIRSLTRSCSCAPGRGLKRTLKRVFGMVRIYQITLFRDLIHVQPLKNLKTHQPLKRRGVGKNNEFLSICFLRSETRWIMFDIHVKQVWDNTGSFSDPKGKRI